MVKLQSLIINIVKRIFVLSLGLLFCCAKSFSQSPACDSIFTVTENPAEYTAGFESLAFYMYKQIPPILTATIHDKSFLPSRLYLRLTITKTGNVSE